MQENKYCTGCGLCKNVLNCTMKRTKNGFQYPENIDKDFEKKYCFYEYTCHSNVGSDKLWGRFENVYLGFSNNIEVRKNASSGGILTEICIYLLESKKVDGIIQIHKNSTNPLKTELIISKNKQDVLNCMGSRYSISEPFNDIFSILDCKKDYAIVGKPCDIQVFRNYCNINNISYIRYYLSFFCAGLPSYDANLNLVRKLGFNEQEVDYLNYRGNGWPGFTMCSNESKIAKMTYEESWGKVLGRDINYICRFCSDGIGEAADIACGDAWYISKDGKTPLFEENDGRNVIFSRNKIGDQLLNEMLEKDIISLSKYNNYEEELKIIQTFQYLRRTTLYSVLKTMKLFGKKVPNYNLNYLKKISKNVSYKQRLKRVLGTIKRIINKKI